jgi:hypothetical protein
MNNCTFVPYIRTYRIFIACTFLRETCTSCTCHVEACLNATRALCSLMCVIVEFLVIPAHSLRLLPYN